MSDTQINVGMNVDGVVAGTNKAKSELRTLQAEVDKVARASKEGGAALGKVGEGVDAEKAAKQLSRIAQQVKRVSDEAVLGRNSVELFAEKLAKTGVNAEVYRPLLDAYSQVRKSTEQTNAEFTKSGRILDQYGNTAKGTAAALRQVPAQFTDIIVSLQGGQAPMTVLLQQGGQLKDVFGGVGNAAKALGGYVLDLINPFTATAAAIAAVGYAAYQGSQDIKAFELALALSGNASGVTTDQMRQLALATGSSADALAQFARAGVTGTEGLQKFADAAVRFEKFTGIAVKDSVAAWKSLGDEPVKNALKLNDTVAFLTPTIYAQIKALEAQGKSFEASVLAQNAYAQAQQRIADGAESKLNSVAYGWDQIAKAIDGAWKKLKDFTQGDPIAKQIADAQVRVKELQEKISAPVGFNTNYVGLAQAKEQLAIEQKRLFVLQSGQSLEKGVATEKAAQNKQLEAQAALDKEHDKYLSKAVERERELTKVRESTARANKGLQETINAGGAGAAAAQRTLIENERKLAEVEAGIRKRFAEAKAPTAKPDAFQSDVAKAYTKAIDDLDKVQLKASASADTLSKTQEVLRGIQSSPEWEAMNFRKKEEIILAASLSQAEEDRNAAMIAAKKVQDDYTKAAAESANSVEKKLQALADETQAYGLSIEKNISLAEAIDLVAIARLEEEVVRAKIANNDDAVKQLEREIKARKELAKELNKKANHTAEVEAGKAAAAATLAEWKRGWEETDRLARDVFTTWATDGSNAAQKIGDTLKKALLSAIYEATLKPIAFQLYTSIAGNGGAAGAVQAASGAGSSLSGLSNVFGTSASLFGAGFKAGLGSILGESGIAGGISAGTTAIGAGNVAGGLGTLAGAIGPVVVGLAALKSAMDYTVKDLGSALVANLGGGSTVVANRQDFQQTGGLFGGGTTLNSEWSAASAELTAYMDAQVKLVTESARAYGTALGLPVADLDSFKQQIEVSLTGLNADQAKEALNKAIAGFGDDLVSANFGASIDGLKQGSESASQTLVRVATEITAVNSTLGMLGGKLLSVDAAGIKAADGLVQAMGGLEAFQQQTASYYSQYYSQEEQRMQTALSIQARLAQGGIDVSIEQVLNGTREQFRALVDSFKDGGGLMDEAGQKAVAALMAVAGAFAGITTASANVSASSAAAAAAATESSFGAGVGTSGPSQSGWSGPGGPDGASEAANAILQERKTLQDELDNLTMTSTELLEKQRNALDESNRALFDQIQVAKEAARVAEQNKSLQDEYNQLTMTATQLRALEREEIAEANLELFDRITALKAEQEAIATANNAVDAALAGVQRAIDAEKKSIEAARQAAQERVGILKSIVDSIGSAVDNLRGNVDSTKAQAARQANAFIDNALATAQASGYMPDADDLKDAISKATAGINRDGLSQFEYEKQQLILAGKLEALGAIADPQLTAAEEAVKVAETQLQVLDDIMEEARKQVDELRGIDTSVKSVEAAIAELASAILGVQAATSGGAVTINPGDYQANGTSTGALEYIGESTGGLSNDFWKTWATHMQNVYGEDAGYKVYNMAIERGVTAAQLEEILGMSAGQANAWALSHGLAAFDVGTNLVPRDMVAKIHEGEAIIPKAYNPAAGGVSGNARLESLVEGLTKEVQRLQAIVNDGNKSNERIATAVNGNPDRPVPIDVLENSAGLATA